MDPIINNTGAGLFDRSKSPKIDDRNIPIYKKNIGKKDLLKLFDGSLTKIMGLPNSEMKKYLDMYVHDYSKCTVAKTCSTSEYLTLPQYSTGNILFYILCTVCKKNSRQLLFLDINRKKLAIYNISQDEKTATFASDIVNVDVFFKNNCTIRPVNSDPVYNPTANKLPVPTTNKPQLASYPKGLPMGYSPIQPKIYTGESFKTLIKPESKYAIDPSRRMGIQYTDLPFGDILVIQNNELKNCEKIGSGEFGIVEKCKTQIATYKGRIVAVKFNKSGSNEELEREGYLMTKFRKHPNINTIIGTVKNPFKIVLEFAEMGDLKNYLIKNSLPEDSLIFFAEDIAKGLAEIHRQDIVHRDFAARNVLIKVVNNELVCVISDFGMAFQLSTGDKKEYYKDKEIIPVKWTSPELLTSHRFTKANDIWAYGITCIEIFKRGADLFPELSILQYYHAIINDIGFVNGMISEKVNEDVYLKAITKNIFVRENARITASQLVNVCEKLGHGKRPVYDTKSDMRQRYTKNNYSFTMSDKDMSKLQSKSNYGMTPLNK